MLLEVVADARDVGRDLHPLVSRTRAILRSAEFGFLGVIVRTCRQTPRFWGAPGIDTWRWRRLFQFLRIAGALILEILRLRPWRTSWLIVGTKTLLLSVGWFGLGRPDRTVGRRRRPGGQPGGDRFRVRLVVVEVVCGAHAVGGPLPKPRRRSVAAARRGCQTLRASRLRGLRIGPRIQSSAGPSADRSVGRRRPRRGREVLVARPRGASSAADRNGLTKSDSSSDATGDGGREREIGRLVVRGAGLAVLEERVVLAAEVVEGLAGEGLEGRPPLALLARGDVRRRARPGRDELADDDVLLEADQVVLGAVDGGLGEHPGRLLEGRRGEEARGVERGLGHAEEHGLGRGRLAALGEDAVVVLLELEAVDELGRQQIDVARLVDADLAQHLADDDLDVLVVDRDALAPVDLLDLLDEVALDGVLAPGVEVLLRVDRPVGDRVAGADLLAVLDQELGVVRDDVLALDDVLGADDEAPLVLDEEALDGRRHVDGGAIACGAGEDLAGLDHVAGRGEHLRLRRDAERRVVDLGRDDLDLGRTVATDDLDDAVDVADLGLALGDAGLEQLLDARQAGGDVQAGDAAGVERPHRQLRARLADRLGGDDADRLAEPTISPVARLRP